MNERTTKPVILLAFANSSANPLPNLATECNQLTAILEVAAKKGIRFGLLAKLRASE